jgi:hypothetical protein
MTDDAISVPGLTLRFVEAPLRRAWWPPFRQRPHAPDRADGIKQLEYVLMWYTFEGDALESYLFWTARGREPPGVTDDAGRSADECRRHPASERGSRSSLPPEFVELATEWLRLRPGRRFIIEADDFVAKAATIAGLLDGLRLLFEQRVGLAAR